MGKCQMDTSDAIGLLQSYATNLGDELRSSFLGCSVLLQPAHTAVHGNPWLIKWVFDLPVKYQASVICTDMSLLYKLGPCTY